MKHTILSLAIFLLVFALVYVGLCYLVPGWRIEFACEGNSFAYFLESIQTGIVRKVGIAFSAALLVSSIPSLCSKSKENREC